MDIISRETLDEVVTRIVVDLTSTLVPALQEGLTKALDGLTITVTVSRKPPA